MTAKPHCNMGVGCDEAGGCFAAAHDEPWRCSRHPREPTELEDLISSLRHQAWHVDHPDESPTNGDLMRKAATLIQRADDIFAVCLFYLEGQKPTSVSGGFANQYVRDRIAGFALPFPAKEPSA